MVEPLNVEFMQRRLRDLHDKLRSRTDHEGKPKKNYETNVAAIRNQIEKLERKLAYATASAE